MRNNCRKMIAALLGLVLAVSLCACAAETKEPSSSESGSPSSQSEAPSNQSEPEPEETDIPMEDAIDDIMDGYYLFASPAIDYNGMVPDDLMVGGLVRWNTTESGDKKSMEALLEKLQNGEKLADNLQTEEYWKAMVYDGDGKLCGSVDVSAVDYKVIAAGLDGEETFRWDFRWPELLESAIEHGELDPNTAKLKACEFAGFATGALLYDDSREYFIPTNRQALHAVSFQEGFIYPMDELVGILSEHIDELFGYLRMATGATDTSVDPEPEGRPEVWMKTFDDLTPEEQMMHWSEEEIWRLMTEIAAQLYQKDEALTGLTPVFRQGSESDVTYSYGIHVSGVPTGYYAYQNDAGEDVAFRAITCSVTWVESERKYLLDLISFEDWKQE